MPTLPELQEYILNRLNTSQGTSSTLVSEDGMLTTQQKPENVHFSESCTLTYDSVVTTHFVSPTNGFDSTKRTHVEVPLDTVEHIETKASYQSGAKLDIRLNRPITVRSSFRASFTFSPTTGKSEESTSVMNSELTFDDAVRANETANALRWAIRLCTVGQKDRGKHSR